MSTESTDSSAATDAEPIGYADAFDELERILDELEDDEIDVDLLADRVARAAELIGICRARIESAQMNVEQIVADLEDLTPPTSAD